MKLQIIIGLAKAQFAETLKLYLEERGHQITTVCHSYEAGLEAYRKQTPDLVLLGTDLDQAANGIDFASFLNEQPQKTPFIYLMTQFDAKIYQKAQATCPYGYLTESVQKEALWMTVEAAYHLYQQMHPAKPAYTIFDGQHNHRVRAEEIVCIESEHVYANVHLKDGRRIVTRKPLRQLLQQIGSKFLLQCHRSFIINIQHVIGWDKNQVTLANGVAVPVSRSKKHLLLESLG